jgi:hypothetical protein
MQQQGRRVGVRVVAQPCPPLSRLNHCIERTNTTTTTMNEQLVTLEDMKAEIRREISARQRLYATWIAKGTFTQDDADRHIGRLRAVLNLLSEVNGALGEPRRVLL